uniref:Membrane-associated salt-inducible protein like n=1 Tax=Oryza sativa subsp. japonica TaxID=39947 RepID=Q655E8_ORYSJ|nr:membrane-associated salt-inducible protein like [Oryza sativa Japonica Group]
MRRVRAVSSKSSPDAADDSVELRPVSFGATGRKAGSSTTPPSRPPTEPHLAVVLCSYTAAYLPKKALTAFRSAVPSLPSPISPLLFNAVLFVFLRCRRHRRVPVRVGRRLSSSVLASQCPPSQSSAGAGLDDRLSPSCVDCVEKRGEEKK